MIHRLSRPLLVAGSVGIVFAMRQVHIAERGEVGGLTAYVAYGVVLAALAVMVGLPYVPAHLAGALFSAVVSSVAGALLWAGLLVVFPSSLPRFVLLASALAVVPWFLVCWWLADRGHQRSAAAQQVVVIADPDELATLLDDTSRGFPADEMAYTIAGAVPTADATATGLAALIGEERGALLVLGAAAQFDDGVLDIAEVHHRQGVRVRTIEQFYEGWLGKLPLSSLERSALLTDVGAIHERTFARLKRLSDLALAVVGALVLLVVTPLVWLGNLVGNRGPLFFTQERVGLGGAPFIIHKFRTMRPDPEGRHTWTREDDPRITPFGAVLRATHLDELPQVLDVLLGHLSWVGPRPEQVRYVRELEKVLPYYAVRHSVKPGITGWAQVKFRYSSSEHDAREKLQYDLYYVRNQSFVLDLKIVKRTIAQVLFGGGR